MGYYMSGGYYRSGGYYMPRGGFFSKVGKVLGKVSGAVGQLAPVATMVNPGLGMAMGSLGNVGGTLFGGQAKTMSPGAGAVGTLVTIGQNMPGSRTGTPTNILGDLAKSLGMPFTSKEAVAGTLVETPNGTIIVKKRRRMNPLNPRALSRSYRRLRSAEKWAHRLFSVAKPHHGVRPKFGRKRSR